MEKTGNEVNVDSKKEKAILSKFASADAIKQNPYPSSLLNLSDLSLPKTSYEIFRWAKYWYTFDPLISGGINALASLPVTDILYEDCAEQDKKNSQEESETLKAYKSNIEGIGVQKLIIEIGINYFLYGNAIILGEKTNEEDPSKRKWKRFMLLDPTRVRIDYNPITGSKVYRWRVPDSVIRIVKSKEPKKEYDSIPEIVKESVLKNKTIILDNNLVYHFSRPTDAMGDNAVWGTPIVANVIKLLMYRNVLRQAQEAIAREHIVPFRVYFLEKTQGFDANAGAGSTVAKDFAAELMKSAADPNYKVVSPVPIGQITMGGNGRSLLLAPEIQQVQEEILAGMNVPREFIFGGVSYSGSSVSLKILENQFRTYRLLLLDFLNSFVVKGMAKFRNEWVDETDDDFLIKVNLSEMKMQDDAQQKQIILQLNQTGKCSDEYMLSSFGMNPSKMISTIHAEKLQAIERQTEIQAAELESQFKLQQLQMKYQQQMPQEMQQQMPGEQQQMPQEQQQEQQQEQEQPAEQGEFDAIGAARQIASMSDQEAAKAMAQVPPQFREKVSIAANIMKRSKKNGEKSKVDMRPLPTKLPPRRESLG